MQNDSASIGRLVATTSSRQPITKSEKADENEDALSKSGDECDDDDDDIGVEIGEEEEDDDVEVEGRSAQRMRKIFSARS